MECPEIQIDGMQPSSGGIDVIFGSNIEEERWGPVRHQLSQFTVTGLENTQMELNINLNWDIHDQVSTMRKALCILGNIRPFTYEYVLSNIRPDNFEKRIEELCALDFGVASQVDELVSHILVLARRTQILHICFKILMALQMASQHWSFVQVGLNADTGMFFSLQDFERVETTRWFGPFGSESEAIHAAVGGHVDMDLLNDVDSIPPPIDRKVILFRETLINIACITPSQYYVKCAVFHETTTNAAIEYFETEREAEMAYPKQQYFSQILQFNLRRTLDDCCFSRKLKERRSSYHHLSQEEQEEKAEELGDFACELERTCLRQVELTGELFCEGLVDEDLIHAWFLSLLGRTQLKRDETGLAQSKATHPTDLQLLCR